MLTCKEAIAVLGDYLEEALGTDTGRELERHLQDCEACVAYLNTYRKTRDLAAGELRAELPAEVKARLRTFLMAKLAELS
jgi:anti-sigma factor RsiW